MRNVIAIGIGFMNIFTVIPAPASGHRIKPAGLASSQNSSSNKASTVQLQKLIHSQICEAAAALKNSRTFSQAPIFAVFGRELNDQTELERRRRT